MAASVSSPWPAGAWQPFATPDRRILLLSIAVQLPLALLLGHSYDMRVFMATGYLVGNGHDPYLAQNLSAVFPHMNFHAMTAIGNPPPWPLVLGLVYRVSYAVVANVLVYNLALKIPVIAATIGLAYLVAALLQNLGAKPAVARAAWVFLLLNPALLYFGAAWGQIDVIVALLSVWALALLYARRWASSAVVLALAVCFKPTALPIVLVAVAYLLRGSWLPAVRYAVVFVVAALLFYVAPFFVFGWSRAPFLLHWNSQVAQSGRMSLMAVVRLFHDPLQMQQRWWLLGLVWIPALAIGALALRRGDGEFEDLLKKSTALVLIFCLTRTWLAETNVVLLIPLVLILTSMGALDRRALWAVWILPLAFTLACWSPLRLLFPSFPHAMDKTLRLTMHIQGAMLYVRAALVIVWQVAGWWIVVACFRRSPAPAGEHAVEAAAP
jgi:hypothetical protein